MNQSYIMLVLWIGVILLTALAIFIVKVFARKTNFRYKPKGPYLLSKGEKVFFDVLVQVISPDLYICPKVRVADLIEVGLPKTDKHFWVSFNKISRKHVDFVLCNRQDFTPRLVIELDGGSHNTQTRFERDIFVNKAFAQTRIPILHVSAQYDYDKKQVFAQVQRALEANTC